MWGDGFKVLRHFGLRPGCYAAFLASMALLAVSSLPSFAQGVTINTQKTGLISGVVRAVDGDTILLWEDGVDTPFWIRLAYIDAPEPGQPCGVPSGDSWDCGSWSTGQLSAVIEGQFVACNIVDKFREGIQGSEASPFIGVCSFAYFNKNGNVRTSDESLNRWILTSGLAIALPDAPVEERVVENAARDARQGLWGSCVVSPKNWRKSVRDGKPPEDWDACPD